VMRRKDLDKCQYCESGLSIVSGEVIYGPGRYADLRFYACLPCKAWVGTHKGTLTPLGTVANAALRRARRDAHAAFDPLWREGRTTRGGAYRWMRRALGLRKHEAHIALFSESQCRALIQEVEALEAPRG